MAEIDARLQDQADERSATIAAGRWHAGATQIRDELFQDDPSNPYSTFPNPQDLEKTYQERMKRLRDSVTEGLTPGARDLLQAHIDAKAPMALVQARSDIRKNTAAYEMQGLEKPMPKARLQRLRRKSVNRTSVASMRQ
jgi:hypothetical protein